MTCSKCGKPLSPPHPLDGCSEPAPLDPSKVKAGDTVTLESGTALVRDVVTDVKAFTSPDGVTRYQFQTAEVPDPLEVGVFYVVGPAAWTLTDHQPAPKPEWKPGTTGTAVVGPNRHEVSVYGVGQGAVIEAIDAGYALWTADDVHSFVPDEPRPLPTRDEVAEVIRGRFGGALSAWYEDADAVLALLRGESR
jgi:hypothetical protein